MSVGVAMNVEASKVWDETCGVVTVGIIGKSIGLMTLLSAEQVEQINISSYSFSPLILFIICFVTLISGMSVLSHPRKNRCFKCWQAGVPPAWVVCVGLVVVQLGFGLYPVVVKKFADSEGSKADPLVLSFYRDLCCFPVLFLCAFVAERKFPIPSLGELVLFILFGLIGMFGNQYLYILGVYKAGPNIASAFQPTIPVWTAALAIATCTEKIPSPRKLPFWAKFFGVLLAAGGAIEITLTRESQGSDQDQSKLEHMLGYLSLFGNTVCMAIYVILQKRFIFDKPGSKWKQYPVAITAYSYFFGAIFMGICSLQYVGTPENREKFKIPPQTLYALVYAIFITSALCYLLITWANSQLSSIIVTAFWPVQVLVAVLASWLILGIRFAPLQYLGAAMLTVGLFFVLWSSYQEEQEKVGKCGIFSTPIDCGLCDFEKNDSSSPLLEKKKNDFNGSFVQGGDDKYLSVNKLPLSDDNIN